MIFTRKPVDLTVQSYMSFQILVGQNGKPSAITE
jgi:hypothetical protein